MYRQVQYRDLQQSLFDQVEHVDDAPRSAVAVVERVDAFELVVDQGHLDERIGAEQLAVVDEPFQVPFTP
jgi:hypothetical protein